LKRGIEGDLKRLFKIKLFTRSDIGCSAYARTGNFTPQLPGSHEICGTVTNSTVSNYSSQICYIITITGNATQTNQTSNQTSNQTGNQTTNQTVNQSSNVTTPITQPSPSSSIPTPSNQPCDIGIGIISNAFMTSESNSYKIRVDEPLCSSAKSEISIWIKDVSGKIISSENFIDTITCSKEFVRNVEVPEGTYFIKAFVESTSCTDTEIANNLDTVAVVMSQSTYETNEFIRIEIPNESYKSSFGSLIEVQFSSYTELPQDLSISVENENSKPKETSIKKPAGFFSSLIQLQLPDNCDREFEAGNYTIKISSAEVSDDVNIVLDSSENCDEILSGNELVEDVAAEITGAITTEKKSGILDSIISFFKGIFGFFA